MENTSYYSYAELKQIGFNKIGKEVYISRKCSIYSPEKISIGSYVRVDDFCLLSGKIDIGSYVHIAAYSALYGSSKGIVLEDFVTLSSRNAIYAATDDYYGEGLSNPLLDKKYRNVFEKEVILKKHVLVGAGCTILPGSLIDEGTSIGAMSLIKGYLESWKVYVGVPSKVIGDRSKKLLALEEELINKDENS